MSAIDRFYDPRSVVSVDVRGGPYAEFDNIEAAARALQALDPIAQLRDALTHEEAVAELAGLIANYIHTSGHHTKPLGYMTKGETLRGCDLCPREGELCARAIAAELTKP